MALTCSEKLAEAKQALHDLSIGKASVEVWDGDFRIKYTQANLQNLQAYVAMLEAECGATAGTSAATRRAIRYRIS